MVCTVVILDLFMRRVDLFMSHLHDVTAGRSVSDQSINLSNPSGSHAHHFDTELCTLEQEQSRVR